MEHGGCSMKYAMKPKRMRQRNRGNGRNTDTEDLANFLLFLSDWHVLPAGDVSASPGSVELSPNNGAAES
jgi:hypothetical protein